MIIDAIPKKDGHRNVFVFTLKIDNVTMQSSKSYMSRNLAIAAAKRVACKIAKIVNESKNKSSLAEYNEDREYQSKIDNLKFVNT